MIPIRLSAPAELDLVEIWEYIAQHNRPAADKVLAQFDNSFRLLQLQPQFGFSADRYAPGLRAFVQGSYVVFYEPTPNEILIYRVLHGARNLDAIFLGDIKSD
jgi:toxin ParE1/3/4